MNPKGSQFESFGEGGDRTVYRRARPGYGGRDTDVYTYTKGRGTPTEVNMQSMAIAHQEGHQEYNYGKDRFGERYDEMSPDYLRKREERHVDYRDYEDYGEHGDFAGITDIRTPNEVAEHEVIEPLVHGGQLRLFGHHHTEGRSEVTLLEGTKAARAMTPTMLGIAENVTRRERGHGISQSSDLSPHSARLVSHLQMKGVLGGEAPEVSNDMNFRPPELYEGRQWRGAGPPPPGVATDIPLSHQEVMQGRATGRAALRGAKPRPKPAPPQYEQQSLF